MIIDFIDGKAQVKDIPITLAEMQEMPIVNGQFILCEDVDRMYADKDGKRIQMELDNEIIFKKLC